MHGKMEALFMNEKSIATRLLRLFLLGLLRRSAVLTGHEFCLASFKIAVHNLREAATQPTTTTTRSSLSLVSEAGITPLTILGSLGCHSPKTQRFG